MGGISIWQLVIVLVIVLLIFGTKKFRNIGSDLGNAIRNFKQSMRSADADGEDKKPEPPKMEDKPGRIIEGQVTSKNKKKA